MPEDKVICLESVAFERLIDRMVGYIKEKHDVKDKWITGDETMKMLNITSPTTMLSLRNNGKIRFSQPMHKVILYDRHSVLEYIESNAKETF